MGRIARLVAAGVLGGGNQPFLDDFAGDGALGAGWTGATWARVSGAAVNTPNLGSELIVNGGFGADTDWTKGAGWTIAGGVGVGTGATGNLVQAAPPAAVGTFYQATYTVGGFSGGSVRAEIGGFQLQNRSANGTYTGQTAQSAGNEFQFVPPSAFTGTIDNVSCKALTLSELIASREYGLADRKVAVGITRTLGHVGGVLMNLDSAASPAYFVAAIFIPGATGTDFVRVIKCVGGTYTSVATTAVTYSAGAELYITKSGTAYRIFYAGAQVGTDRTISDAGIIGNTKHGLFSASASISFDNFSVTNP